MNNTVIAIDGYSSTGKSTLAKELANKLNYKYIDTGAMYRAVTLYAIENKCLNENGLEHSKLASLLPDIKLDLICYNNSYNLLMNGSQIEDKIRGLEVSSKVSHIAKIPEVRKRMVEIQQQWGESCDVIMDGRDIGTVVFPNAQLKIFMTASSKVRAERRYNELINKGENVSFDDVLKNIIIRDEIDSNREIAPLKPANDSIIIDNSELSRKDQLDIVLKLISKIK